MNGQRRDQFDRGEGWKFSCYERDDWHIGAEYSATGGAQGFFDGEIDEAQVFNRVLTDAEILAEYQAGSTGKCWSANFCPTITLSPATLPGGAVGAAYDQMLTAGGGTGPYGFAVTAGALPPGLTLETNGQLHGTPTAAGPYNFTVTATDVHSCTGNRAYGMTINPLAPPTPVPTLTEWGLLLLAGLVAGYGTWTLRRSSGGARRVSPSCASRG